MLLGPRGGADNIPSGKIRMDTAKAMALLGFSSSRTFEQVTMAEVQTAFMFRVHALEMEPINRSDPRARAKKTDELRKVNEAFQYLTKKGKKLSGRSMTANWQIVGGKSSVVQKIFALKAETVDQPQKERNPLASVLMRNEHLLKASTSSVVSGLSGGSASSSSVTSSASSGSDGRSGKSGASSRAEFLKPSGKKDVKRGDDRRSRSHHRDGHASDNRPTSPSVRLTSTSVRRPLAGSPARSMQKSPSMPLQYQRRSERRSQRSDLSSIGQRGFAGSSPLVGTPTSSSLLLDQESDEEYDLPRFTDTSSASSLAQMRKALSNLDISRNSGARKPGRLPDSLVSSDRFSS